MHLGAVFDLVGDHEIAFATDDDEDLVFLHRSVVVVKPLHGALVSGNGRWSLRVGKIK